MKITYFSIFDAMQLRHFPENPYQSRASFSHTISPWTKDTRVKLDSQNAKRIPRMARWTN